MMKSKNKLKIVEKRRLPEDTYIYQTCDGTLFHWCISPLRLYVELHGKEFDAILPSSVIHVTETRRDAVIFISQEKVYKAVFSPLNGITVSYLRDEIENEDFLTWGLCTRMRKGERFLCRISDDPETEGILLDVSDKELEKLEPLAIHRGAAFYCSYDQSKLRPSIRRIGRNVIIIEASFTNPLTFARDSSDYIYIFVMDNVETLDTNTMTFLSALYLEGVREICNVTGVEKDLLNLNGYIDDKYYVATVQLPIGYYETMTVVEKQQRKIADFFYAVSPTIHTAISKQGPLFMVREQKWRPPHVTRDIQDPFESEFLTRFIPGKVLGQGAFGCVFEVENKASQFKYAVKRIPIRDRDEAKALSEVRALAKLYHPGVIRFYDSWIERPPEGWQLDSDVKMIKKIGSSRNIFRMNYQVDSAFLYIQMQLCRYSLAEWLNEYKEPSTRAVLRISSWFKQILSAVAYLHEMNVIHRDLKPGNILFFAHNHLKVCDLGFATERIGEGGLQSAVTRTNIGTALYMSPENSEYYAKYSSKTDVYALGLILAEMSVVMTSEDRAKTFSNFRHGRPSGLTMNFEAFDAVEAMTRMDPERRPTCRAMLHHPYVTLYED